MPHHKRYESARRWRVSNIATVNELARNYNKTPKGLMVRTYRNMKSRVTGVQTRKAHIYEGLSLLSKEEFYEWTRTNRDYYLLFCAWVASGHARKLTPSINRLDSDRGYDLDNIEWITHSENSREGSLNQRWHYVRNVEGANVFA